MGLFNTIAFLGAASLASAIPLQGRFPADLIGRDNGACYPQNLPIGKSDFNCPKKQTLDSNGHCNHIGASPTDQGCTAYCEVRVTPSYGREVPIMDGACQSSTTCSVAQAQSVTVTNTVSINIGPGVSSGESVTKALTGAFDLGASWSYSTAVGYTTTEQFSKTLDAKTCGYWTFIPYMFESCGTLSKAEVGENSGQHGSEIPYCKSQGTLTDIPNWCNVTPYQDSNGHADGKVVFVYTDCSTNTVLANGQDPAYTYPGVSTGPK